jgi:hypothetical protein
MTKIMFNKISTSNVTKHIRIRPKNYENELLSIVVPNSSFYRSNKEFIQNNQDYRTPQDNNFLENFAPEKSNFQRSETKQSWFRILFVTNIQGHSPLSAVSITLQFYCYIILKH